MRGFASFLLCSSITAVSVWAADGPFPYVASVSVAEVEVRCGPGWDYYPTQRLKRGQQVDVYRHETGGWLAIRPPEGSFSWITARQLKMSDEEGIAEVAVDGAVAWVGSAVSSSAVPSVGQHKWQVRLKRGEKVGILGEQAISVGPGFATETYYRIAPPSGEFRWIHAENATSSHHNLSRSQSSSDVKLANFQTQEKSKPESKAETTQDVRDPVDKAELSKRIDQLNLELSLLVTRDIEQWNLRSLRGRADALRVDTTDAELARSVRAIAQRISDFERLQSRYQKLASETPKIPVVKKSDESPVKAPGEVPTDDTGLRPVPKPPLDDWFKDIARAVGGDATPKKAKPDGSVFDAEGWLMPVHSTKRIAPYALLDDDGRVKCYVTPTPGLNLRRYVKKNVGLLGERRHVDALRASHITAERIVKQKITR